MKNYMREQMQKEKSGTKLKKQQNLLGYQSDLKIII